MKNRNGSIYLLVLVSLTIASVFIMVFVQKAHYLTRLTRSDQSDLRAIKLAETAINEMMYTLVTTSGNVNRFSSWDSSSYSSPYYIYTGSINDASYSEINYDGSYEIRIKDNRPIMGGQTVSFDVIAIGTYVDNVFSYNRRINAVCYAMGEDSTYNAVEILSYEIDE